MGGELPESWIPPAVILEWRERVRLYKSLTDQRTDWIQRIHAELYQHGVALPEGRIRSTETRDWLLGGEVELSPAARQRIEVGYRMLETTDTEAQYGIGPLTAVVVWSELGDCRRFSRSMQVVRHTSLDPTVDASNQRRNRGYLSRQGPGTLRWALFEAGMSASRATSPDRDYYQAVKAARDGKLAAISMARKLARRCYHTLRSIDPAEIYAIPAGF